MKRKNHAWKIAVSSLALFCILSTSAFASKTNSLKVEPPEAAIRNIALGASYTVSQGFHDDSLMGYENNRSKPGLLTNGKFGMAGTNEDFLDPEWIGYLRQVSREVVIDLGQTKRIDSIHVDLLQHGTVGVGLPRYINYYLSDDNNTWHEAGTSYPSTPLTQGGSRETAAIEGLESAARYVKVELAVGTFTFLDEIEVMGSDEILPGRKPLSGKTQQPAASYGMLRSGAAQAGGISNMFLAYLYQPGSYPADLSIWKQDDFRRIVTHTDTSGKPTDWMFDSVLFMAGGSRADYGTQSQWASFLNEAFAQGMNLEALDQTIGEAKQTLSDKKHKEKVVLAIPFPDPKTVGTWGTVDGKSISLSTQSEGEKGSLNNRVKAVQWFVHEAEMRFKEAHFDHLELSGFYWVQEEIGYDSTNEENLVKQVSSIVHEGNGEGAGNKKLYWIPFYQANGFTFWKDLGFDAVMMQPNYYFNGGMGPSPQAGGDSDFSRLRNTAALAERFGMGVEMEGDYQMTWKTTQKDYDGTLYNGAQTVQKFYNYMNVFTQTGLNQSMIGYYWGARSVLEDIVSSQVPYVRTSYDDAYLFTKDRYQVTNPDLPVQPAPGEGDEWSKPIQLQVKEGDVYNSSVAPGESKWLKFPIAAGQDWVVTLTPDNGSTVGLETRYWAESQTPQGGFSYLGNQTQSLLVSNRTGHDGAIMLRVFANDDGGGYKLSLHKPVEDGMSKVNALPLLLGNPMQTTVISGQEVWYKVSGEAAYSLKLSPSEGADMDLELYWGSNYTNVLANSYNGAGSEEAISYNNPYDPQFVYFVKVKAKTDGSLLLTAN
jgi:hypothetical protein